MKKRTWLILLVALFVLTASLSAAELWLPRGLKTIEEEAFAGDHAIQGVVTLPDGVETVGAGAFKDTDLYALVLPESVQQVGSHAVGGEKLVYATIRGEHTAFAADALEGVRAVIGYHPKGYEGAYEYVSFDDLCRQDGFIYRIEGDHVVIVCPEDAAELSGEITIPMQLDNGMAVQGGANCSFAGCWNVTAVHLPAGCEGLMDDGAFDELHEGASVDYYAEMEPLNAYFQPDGVSERMPVGQVFSMKVEIYNAEHPDQYTVSSADESIVAPNGDGTFTAKQVGVTDMVLTDEYGRTTTWMVCVRSLDSKQIIPILGLDYPTDNEGNPMDTLTAGDRIPVCVSMSNGDKLADLRDERTHMEFCIELLDAKGAVLKREDNIQAWNTFTDWTTVTYGFRYSDMDWAEFYAQGAEAVRVTIQAHDDTHETVNHEVDADRSSITLKIMDWNAQEPYITMKLSGLLKNGTIDRNRHFYVTLTSHNPQALPGNGLELYVPYCADQQMMTREQPSVTLAVWPSDGREYYEVRAVNHDTDEDYLLSGLNLTCAEELQGDFYAEDIEPRIAVGTTFRMKAEIYNAENPDNYTIAPRNAEIIRDNGDGTFTAIAEGATEMVLTDEIGRELTWAIRVHAVDAEQVRPVVYLDYAQDGEGNQRTSVSAMEGLPYRVGLTNAEDMEKIQDAGANIRIRRELLGSDGQVLATWSDFEAYNHFTNWTESDLEVDMDTFRWSALYARQAAAVRLTLIPQDEGDYSFINYDVDDTRNSITLTIDDWRTDSELYLQMAVSGLLKNGLAARYTHIQLTLTSLNPEALPESGLHVYVPDYADEQVLTRDQPTVTLQVWTDGGAEWFEVKGYVEGIDDDYWFGGFHMEYADDLQADFYGSDVGDRMTIGTTFHMNVEIHNSETPDQYTISVEDDSVIQDNGDGSYTAIGAGVTNMLLTDSIGRQTTWTVRVHETDAAQVRPELAIAYATNEETGEALTSCKMLGSVPIVIRLSNEDQIANLQDEGSLIRIRSVALNAAGDEVYDFGAFTTSDSFVNWTEHRIRFSLDAQESEAMRQSEAVKIKIMLVPYDEGENSDVNYDIDSSRSSIFLDIVEN